MAGNKLKFRYIPSKISCTSIFATLFKVIWQNFAKTYQQVIKFVTIGTFCYSWVTFIKISIKDNSLLWYKSIHIIYRSFQDVLGYKIIKLHVFINANIYLFCKLNLNTTNLKRPVKFKFHKSTIATHSTIAYSQH